jgi:hypothetical protein
MKNGHFIGLLILALFLAMTPTVVASSTWYVDGVNGSDSNNCLSSETACKTIGHAISLAASGDSIMVAASTYAENLTISFSLNVIGAGAGTTIVHSNGGSVVTVSVATANVTLSNLTITGGFANNGGGIFNNGTLTINNSTIARNRASFSGGGIYNSGTLRVIASTLSLNYTSLNSGYGPCYFQQAVGGGIYNKGVTAISNSTLNGNTAVRSGNSSCHSFGGGIFNGGSTLTITNSTISANHAVVENCLRQCTSYGGGVYNAGGTLKILNSTLSGNGAAAGGGIFGTATLQNSIVANSPSGGNCSGTMTSNGYNLNSDNTCNFNGPGDLNNVDPVLGVLQNNGGATQTMALLSGSPAIDAGNPSGCTDNQGNLLKTDQRGMPRPDPEDKGGCDMGAYESQTD